MNEEFMKNLSADFVIGLYRLRSNAERRQDHSAIESLKLHYPEIFTAEFEEFIENYKLVLLDLKLRHGDEFSNPFDNEEKKVISSH